MRVVLAGGGTAGHIEPALNLADALLRRDSSTDVTALGTERGLETTLVPARGYPLELIPAVPMPRRPGRDLLAVGPRVARSVNAAARVIRGADVLVGFGGYVALPAYLAARRVGVPIVVHEANARAGLANRVGARLTPYVAQAVPGTIAGARDIGMPLRPAIAHLDRAAERAAARATLGLEPDAPTLLVFGGSQGAQRLNGHLADALPALRAAGIQVLHAIGPRNELPEAGDLYRPVPYIERMDLAYAAADLAMCRSGAMTCAEVTAVGLPAIYVPLPIGNGEQRLNAEPIVTAGGGLMIDDASLTSGWIARTVIGLVGDTTALVGMSRAASGRGMRDADERLADLVQAAVRRSE